MQRCPRIGRLRRYTEKNIIRWSVEMQSTDEKYMKEAIKQAKKAYAIGEVPIGCVIVYQDRKRVQPEND